MKQCKCYKCDICKKLDLQQREKNGWWDVELFRIIKGKLPGDGDALTKKDAENYINRFVVGSEKYPKSSCDRSHMDKFAFHVFSSSNQAYIKE